MNTKNLWPVILLLDYAWIIQGNFLNIDDMNYTAREENLCSAHSKDQFVHLDYVFISFITDISGN